MGLLFSVLQSILDCFRGSRKNDYLNVNTNDAQCSAEKPKLHSACRSLDENNLTPYQNKIDNLKPGEIVKVSWERKRKHTRTQ